MSDDQELFDTPDTFEGLGQENGDPFWWQSDLQGLLGYKGERTFALAVSRALQAMIALGVPAQDHFRHERRLTEAGAENDCKLSRFACYLTAMNADPKKPEVARVQAYFATLADVARKYIEGTEGIERVLTRDEISDQENALSAAAQTAGVQHYLFFRNAGYRGLYNMNLTELKRLKGVPSSRTALDFMGKEELAANLFRITQTEAQIRSEAVFGQEQLEGTARRVGRQVREAIEDIGGTMPENLPLAGDIREVKKHLKQAGRELKKVPTRKNLPPGEEGDSEE